MSIIKKITARTHEVAHEATVVIANGGTILALGAVAYLALFSMTVGVMASIHLYQHIFH